MFIHEEDGTEVQVKITNNGDLYVFCPKCKRIWRNVCTVIVGGQQLTSPMVILAPSMGKMIGTSYGAGTEMMVDVGKIFQPLTRTGQRKIMFAAKKAFPEAFKK